MDIPVLSRGTRSLDRNDAGFLALRRAGRLGFCFPEQVPEEQRPGAGEMNALNGIGDFLDVETFHGTSTVNLSLRQRFDLPISRDVD